jgi:Spy/CpxP family protein refolding chaperone
VFQGPEFVQQRFLERMKTELKLSPEQSQRMEALFRETRVKMKNWWDIVGPEMQTELREVKEKTRAILNSEQREKFEQLLKDRRRSPGGPGGEKRPHDRRQPGPGGGGSNVSPAGPNLPPVTPGPKPSR